MGWGKRSPAREPDDADGSNGNGSEPRASADELGSVEKSYRRTVRPGLDATLDVVRLLVNQQPTSCWILKSDGLSRWQQAETSFVIPCDGQHGETDKANAVLSACVKHLAVMADQAEAGNSVNAGSLTGYGSPAPWESFSGVLYVTPPGDSGVPPDMLLGILLYPGEVEMAQVSNHRVLSALGRQARHYPFPWWSIAERPSVYEPGDRGRSLLAGLPGFFGRDSYATVDETLTSVVATLSVADAGRFADQLESHPMCALSLNAAPNATGALVWSPGQNGPGAITGAFPDEQQNHLSLAVLGVTHSATETNLALTEDGVVVLANDQTLTEIVEGLRNGSPVLISDPDCQISISVG